ncbi:MAG: glycine--tRNA ligase subunit beta [Acidobacteriia bacterium]|nr:glycine--tRNA ligase subunit beta [Terriglobia bacterium]
MSLDFLLEIGTEEIPHWMIPGASAQLAKMDLLGVTPSVDATPRRLVVRAQGLPDRTPDSEQVVKGPPITAGDKAAEGFAKKQGADASALRKAGNYYELVKKVSGRAAIDILAESLHAAILGIQWPKTMYWTDRSGPRFIRPIRWLVALLGDQVIPIEIGGVRSGNVTRGHRILGASSIPVTIATYESELRKNFVILAAHERRHKIEKECADLGAKLDGDLVETLTYITEFPTAIRGDFDPAYLALPAEVLTTVMRHHQKYFSVENPPGMLEPNFVAVMNTAGDPEGLVKHGNERVLKARFNDARFFWNVDQARKLADRVDDLAKVTFQAKLGSYKEKTDRVVALVKELGGDANAQRAALLCKCDLTTEMVKEFTDLQGVVGGLYATAQGEPEAVSRAIYEHYEPLSMDDSIPSTREGQILALADKLDTLRGCFAVGLIPSGSKDPFALRRAAQGVVKILVEAKLDYQLSQLAQGELVEFMMDRVKYYFREVRGFKYDEVNAVLAAGCWTLADVEARLTALAEVRPTENFEPLAASFKRIRNILKQSGYTGGERILEEDFEQDAEKELYRELERVVKVATDSREYRTTLAATASTRPSVDRFFDKVMVMDESPIVRARRLELLYRINMHFSTIADFSEIVTSGAAQDAGASK